MILDKNNQLKGITLKTFIDEQRILKTQVKLYHIMYLDEDIMTLQKERLTLSNLTLEDIYLLEQYHMIVPVAKNIIPYEENDLLLKTYLIYLSYLYMIDLYKIYEENKEVAQKIILNLHISKSIKDSFIKLLNKENAAFFSSYIGKLNTPEYRLNVKEDSLVLKRSVKINKNMLTL